MFWQLGVWHEASGQVGQKKKRIAAFLESFVTNLNCFKNRHACKCIIPKMLYEYIDHDM